MVKSLRQRLKPLYRNRWLPLVSAPLTLLLRLGIALARSAGIVRPALADDPECFLIVSLAGHLGDTVMLLPGIEALRQAHPNARIEAAVEAGAAPLLRQIDLIDQVHEFRLGAAPPITFALSWLRAARIIRLWWPRRRDLRATVAVVPRWGDDLFGSITLAYLTQALRRIGFVSDVLPGLPPARYRDALLTERVGGGNSMHEPLKFLRLLIESGLIPTIPDLEAVSRCVVPALVRVAHRRGWTELSTRLGLPQPPFAVLAPGASMPRRIYPLEKWLPVIASLNSRGLTTILLAGASDADTARRLHAMAPDTTLVAGVTTLVESAALIAQAALFLGNDSGPGHLAGAIGVPSVILFIAEPGCDPDSPAAPERVRPAGPHVTYIRPKACVSPCSGSCTASEAHCIATILPAEIIQAADELLMLAAT